ncbi:MAG: hypothetical protein ACK4YV_07790 [Emticicia sp.]
MKKINPPYSWLIISLWGICFISYFAASAQITTRETPKQRVIAFMKWYDKTDKIPFEGDCYEVDGVDITSIDTDCLQNYIKKIQRAGLFSSIYLESLKQEFIAKKAEIRKSGYATGIDFDRYTLSQDPPTGKELLAGFNNFSSSTITGSKAKVIVNLEKPYKVRYIYSLDLENNTWKLSKIESK